MTKSFHDIARGYFQTEETLREIQERYNLPVDVLVNPDAFHAALVEAGDTSVFRTQLEHGSIRESARLHLAEA